MHTPLQWKVCRLLPAIQNVFTAASYPARNKVGNMYAFYAVLPTYPPRVALTTPSMKKHEVKLLTLELAANGLEDVPVGTKAVTLNDKEALAALETYPGVIYSYLNLTRQGLSQEPEDA